MTYEKAMNALVAAGLLDQTNVAAAVTALKKPNVEFAYPDWAKALAKAGLIAESAVDSAANVMENAQWDEADTDPDALDKGLEDAGIL